ncbi:MAG: anaerobic ribonucleoside-triphosphate reductase activating protein [Desulfobacteraceae bacterium]|nr:anaerobic ribonucleoside-triphosphate reductase activating protein [Desulfobacteraceae bacterium]MCB9495236.1 anaerobic ribonucleoside-triphosphate reductase activating protein [Desulfobacteraceae bacterium]
MIAGGFQKNSLIDYPGKISSVLFTKGCNFKCPYCHNPELIPFEKDNLVIDINEFFSFLQSRKNFIDAVVITGGEPCLQKNIIEFALEIKKLGFFIKLDTNGSRPEIIEELLKKKTIDLIAMDIKTTFDEYHRFTSEKDIENKLNKSVNLIINSNTDYYFRTTCAKPLVTKENFSKIMKEIQGAKKYVLQKFIEKKVFKPDFFKGIDQFSEADFKWLKDEAEKYVKICKIN